jgi:hypothetical protein
VLKRAAFPTALIATLILTACGGNGPAIPQPASTSPAAPAQAPVAAAEEPAPAEEPAADPVVDAAAVAHLYVATNGSDSNPGTKASPFKTIVKASQVAQPGTVVHVAPGNYAGGFTTSRSGTSAARVRFVSDTKWGAKIVPSSATAQTAWLLTGSYVDVVDFHIDGNGGTRWLNGLVSQGSYNKIEGLHVHHIAMRTADCGLNGGSGINAAAHTGGKEVSINGNVVHHIGIAGCHGIHGIYHSSTGEIKNNLIHNIGYGGIHLWHDASHIDIVNNTVFATGIGIIVGTGGFYFNKTKMVDYVNVHNNLVYDNNYGIINSTGDGTIGTHNTYVNNLSFKNVKTNFMIRNATHTGSIIQDPVFSNYQRDGSGDYRIKSTSPAMGYGSPTYAPATDLNGSARPQGGRDDIGAYEYIGTAAR